jgi:Trypsin-like peptidase domain
VGTDSGTAFTIDVDGRRYLVTAKHIAGHLKGTCQILIFRNGNWSPLTITVIGHAPNDIDISVLTASEPLTPPDLPLAASADGLAYGQEAYFLGFPYNILTKYIFSPGDFPLPFVKRATVSVFDGAAFLLDGHNNPGFSGGPVVFKRPNQQQFQVAAVISSFKATEEPVFDQDKKTSLTYLYNTGIIVAYQIGHATSVINDNPSGLLL